MLLDTCAKTKDLSGRMNEAKHSIVTLPGGAGKLLANARYVTHTMGLS
jgi:hypothetical protein